MNKIFSGHQPNFIPYMGFFYKMYKADEFVLDDDVKYSRKGLHNANYLCINGQRHKVSIPVSFENGDLINEVRISYAGNWKRKLLRMIETNYRKYDYFEEVFHMIQDGLNNECELLADMNIFFIREIAQKFGIDCTIRISSKELKTELKKNERNIFQALKLGCNVYYSGTGGKAYNDEELYNQNGIKIIYSDYIPIVDNLSVVDYLMKEGFSLPNEWK